MSVPGFIQAATDTIDSEDDSASGDAGASPVLKTGDYAGPIDWWLAMARAQKIDLAQLSITALIGGFSAAMDTALTAARTNRLDRQIEHWAAWTVTAATLTELWSRLLLPPDTPAARAAVAEAEDLRRLLADRAATEAAANWLEQRPQLGRDSFRRGQPELGGVSRAGDRVSLLRACLVALQVPPTQAEALRPRPPPLWTARDALAHVKRLSAELSAGSPMAAYVPPIGRDSPGRALRCRAAVASTLIACLELARDGTLTLTQADAGQAIRVTRQAMDHPAASEPGPVV